MTLVELLYVPCNNKSIGEKAHGGHTFHFSFSLVVDSRLGMFLLGYFKYSCRILNLRCLNKLGHLCTIYIQLEPNADLQVMHELEFVAILCDVHDADSVISQLLAIGKTHPLCGGLLVSWID